MRNQRDERKNFSQDRKKNFSRPNNDRRRENSAPQLGLFSDRETANKADDNAPKRLNKYLADAGIASRRHADDLIEKGAVKINGKVVTEMGTRVTQQDLVTVNGEPVSNQKHLTYILLNKPKDIITTADDEQGRKTVFDIVKVKQRLFPVGRLDRNTTGILLLTNDGELANRLMHPRYEVQRVYNVGLDKKLRPEDARKISQGVELEDGKTSPCEVYISPEDYSQVQMTMIEGRNREIRRIYEALGYVVKKLDRKSYAFLSTRGMKRGEYRHLNREEVKALRRMVGLD